MVTDERGGIGRGMITSPPPALLLLWTKNGNLTQRPPFNGLAKLPLTPALVGYSVSFENLDLKHRENLLRPKGYYERRSRRNS